MEQSKNQISDRRKIRIKIGQKECSLSKIFVYSLIFLNVRLSYKSIRI